MGVIQAAEKALRKTGTPMHAKDITNLIITSGLWQSSGKNPEATVSSGLYVDIKKHGDQSKFIQTGPMTFSLRDLSYSDDTELREVRSTGTYTFTDCARMVLEQFGKKQPLYYRDITLKAIEMGWLHSEGKTPEATMYAQIFSEIKRQQKRGELPRFVQHGRGFFGLSQWMGRGLEFQIQQHNQQVRKALLKQLLAMDPAAFEELVSQLLAEMGLEMVEVTKLSGDGGIDVRGTLVLGEAIRINMAVQAKRWKPTTRVQSPLIQQLRGSLGAHEHGVIITTSDFSSGAKKEAVDPGKTPIALINGEQLVMLLMEHSIGVSRSSIELFDVITEDSEEL